MKKSVSTLETFALEFCELDAEKRELDRRCRHLKRRLTELQESIQEHIGTTDIVDVPLVSRIGRFLITQIKKHRRVCAHEYDFVEFKVLNIKGKSPGILSAQGKHL